MISSPALDQNLEIKGETIIIPAMGTVPKSPPLQPLPPTPTSSSPPFAPSGQANPWPKRLMIIMLFLLLGIGALLAGKFILSATGVVKGTTLIYWGLWENEEIIKPVIAEYESKHPGIKITYLKQSQRQYRERLQAAIRRGEGPDIFRFHNTWVPMLVNDLNPVPSTVMTSTEFSSTYYPVAVNDLVAGQTIYGIPLMIDGLGLYYNEDLFAAAGIANPPATWEELLAMSPKIAKPEGNGFAVSAIALGTTANVEHYSDIIATMFMQNGAKLINPTGKEAEEALIFYKKFATPTDPVYTWNDTMDNCVSAFANAKVAMIMAPSWRVFEIKQLNPKLHFKIAPIPQLPGNAVTWASYWVEGVSSRSKNQKAAWEFVKFLTSRDTATKLYTEEQKTRLFGEPYARVDLGNTLTGDPYAGAYISQAVSARSFPLASRTFDNGLNDKMIQYMENAINALGNGSSPASELETVSSGFKQVLSTYGLISNTAPGNP